MIRFKVRSRAGSVPVLRLTRSNIVAAAVSALLLMLAFIVAFNLNGQTNAVRAEGVAIEDTRTHLREWQTLAPSIIHNEARARVQIAPYCQLSGDMNGALLRIASRITKPGVQVAAGNYRVATIPALLATPFVSDPQVKPSTPPVVTAPPVSSDANVPRVADGVAEISKAYTVEGRYANVIDALAGIDRLRYPLGMVVDSITRKGASDVTVAVTLTLRVPTADVCAVPGAAPSKVSL